MAHDLKAIRKALDDRVKALAELRPSHREVLEFCAAVVKEQLKAKDRIQVESMPSRKEKTCQNEKGGPPLLENEIPVDLGEAKKLFRSLCRIAKKQNQALHEAMEKIEKAIRSKRIDVDRLLGEVMLPKAPHTDDVSSSLKLSRDILVFLVRASIQPFLEEMALKLAAQFDHGEWNKGTCPICGSSPIVSELSGEQGKRMWICSLCGHRWEARRMGCPFCGREDPESHRYLFVEGDETVRIDVCEGCRKYIKTVDSRKLDLGIFPLVEYMGTIHLDVLAQQEGYKRGATPFLDIG